MPCGREAGGELCGNKAAPMIRECPDCVDAFIERATQIRNFAVEMAYQVWEAKNLKEAHQAVADTVSTYKRPVINCAHIVAEQTRALQLQNDEMGKALEQIGYQEEVRGNLVDAADGSGTTALRIARAVIKKLFTDKPKCEECKGTGEIGLADGEIFCPKCHPEYYKLKCGCPGTDSRSHLTTCAKRTAGVDDGIAEKRNYDVQ